MGFIRLIIVSYLRILLLKAFVLRKSNLGEKVSFYFLLSPLPTDD